MKSHYRISDRLRASPPLTGLLMLFPCLILQLTLLPTGASAQYTIPRSTLDMAGTVRRSSTYRLVDASGQTAAEVSMSSTYLVRSGFLAFGLVPVGIAEPRTGVSLPRSYGLAPNYPNPFNPATTIRFEIPAAAGQDVPVRLEILNLRGQRVRTLVEEHRGPGSYVVHWDGRSDQGELASSGVYLYRITAGRFTAIRKMVVLK